MNSIAPITPSPTTGNDILSEIATGLIKDAISTGWNKVSKFFKDLDAQDSIRYGSAYFNYLSNTQDKNGKIKTLIYRRIPKDLYSFYECLGVDYDGETIDTTCVKNLLELSNKIVVTGTGGSGKSILLKHFFLNTIQTTDYIPVLIELRKFNFYDIKEISLYDAVYQSLSENGFALEEEYFSFSMKEGAYVILLDGFDEINRDRVGKVSAEIRSLSDKYGSNNFIISSRPTDAFIGWQDFSEVSSLPLTKKQALSLINKIEFDDSVKKTFYEALDKSLFSKYHSFASNPLLLTIMLLTFNNHASIPEKLNDFYEEAFATLYNMHDATKDCYVRDIRTKLGSEDFKSVFAYICFKSYFSSEFEFSESRLREYIQKAKEKFSRLQFSIDDFQEDLILSVCMLVKDGLNYRFTHRSFQEYFAAWYTCKITDELQSKLLSSWLSESDAAYTDEYLSMLFNLQPEKVNTIIFLPGLKKVQALYNDFGFTVRFLESLFSGVTLSKGRDKSYSLGLRIKNRYLCNVLRSTCKYNSYPYSNAPSRLDDEIVKKMLDKDPNPNSEWPFEVMLDYMPEVDLLDALSWFHTQYQFCTMIVEKYTTKDRSRKRKLSSIIDEL